MTLTYQALAQLAADYKRLGLSETAALVEVIDGELAERFGPPEEWRVSAATVPPWLPQMVEELRARERYAERGDQYGHTDPGTALGCIIAISVLARAVSERDRIALTPAAAQSAVGLVRNTVAKSFERIMNSVALEGGKARFLTEQRWQETRRATLGQQKRDQQIAELNATKARLEQALSDEVAS